MTEKVTLRPVAADDLSRLLELLEDPELAGEYQWFGFRGDRARELQRRFETDGLLGHDESYLAVGLEEGTCAGWVVWLPVGHFGNYEIGITLFPEHRGRGIGTEAQRLLVEYLFATTPAFRLQAGTEVDNVAEQKALERVGFRKEGIQRGLYFQAGGWRDNVMYGLTRDDVAPGETSPTTLREADEQPIAVRPAEGGDRAWATELLCRRWSSSTIVSRGRIHATDQLPALIAESPTGPCGLATYWVEPSEIELVTLDAEPPGRGAGSALLAAVIEVGRGLGCRRLTVITTNDNLAAIGFYQRRGLRLIGVHSGAVDTARRIKPEIPEVGEDGIPVHDEIELGFDISGSVET